MSQHAAMSATAAEIRSIRDQSSINTLPMIVKLEIWLRAAENYMAVAKRNDNGDMWAKGYYRVLDLSEQIAMLENLTEVAQ